MFMILQGSLEIKMYHLSVRKTQNGRNGERKEEEENEDKR